MSVTSGFFNSLSGDRKYDAIQISSMFDGLITDGIYNGYLESFMVTASSPASMVVTVGEGRCWFNHTWTLNDAPLPLTLDVGDVVLNRIDTIVIDVDSTDTVRACTIKVVKGTPSSQAVRPTLENTEAHHQYPLCDISVPAGATTVTQSNITNRRGTSDCPFVATLMESVDVDDLLIQWESQWNDWMTDRANAMDSWTAEQQEAFTTWFQTVQDILDENTAGNLLNRINHRTGINATATYSAGVVAITAPDDAGEILTFVAPSDFLSSDTYTLNGEAITITDLNGEALDDAWKKNSPVTITVSGGKAFFKAGGSGKNDTLPPLLGNMTVEVVEGDENDTYTIKMDKLILDKTTEMVGGAQLEWGEEMPAKPGKGTGGIKTWTREEIITTGKPYDGLYLGDVTPSDAVTETLIYLPENDSGKVKLVPFIVLSTDYLSGVYVMRQKGNKDWVGKYGNNVTYENSTADTWLTSYLNSVLDKSIADKVLECEIHVFEQGTIKRKCWIPSYGELHSDFTDSGNTFMPYFNSNGRRALIKQDDGNLLSYWTRTFYNLSNVRMINPDGSGAFRSASNETAAYRPSFVLPKDFKIQQRPDGSYTVWDEQGLLTLGDIEASTDVIETTVNAAEMHKSSTGPKAIITELSYDKKNYNKTDGGLLVRKELIKESIAFSGSPGNYLYSYPMIGADEWATAEIRNVTRTDFVLLDSFKKILMSTPIKYRENGTVTKEVTKKGFLLSIDEVGNDHIWGDSATGEEIERYWNQPQNRISYYGNAKRGYWLRDGAGNNKDVYIISASGVPIVTVSSMSYGIKVACVVPLTTPIRALADGSYDLVPEDPALATQGISTMAAAAGTPVQLKDIPVSDADNTSTLILPEKNGEQAYIYVSENYEETGAACAFRGVSTGDSQMRYRGDSFAIYTGNGNAKNYCDAFVENYLDASVLPYVVTADINSYQALSSVMQTVSANAFPLAAYEMGYTDLEAAIQAEGPLLPYFDGPTARADERNYYTRTGRDASNVVYVTSGGSMSYMKESSSSAYIRPAILLSPETWFIDNGDDTYTFVGDEPESSEFVSHTVEVPHGQKVVFRQFTQNQKKQFQTMLVGAVYPPLGDVEPTFQLPEFTGNHAIFGDETAGRIELYESGELTLSPGTYDLFLVGGGGSGTRRTDTSVAGQTGGGGGGYTFTQNAVEILTKTDFTVSVGAGGYRAAGSASTIVSADASINYTAAGGGFISSDSVSSWTRGANGGSGGGGGGNSYGGSGGSDGGNGVRGGNPGNSGYGGTGQGTTTRMFGEEGGTLFGGAGGGGGDDSGGAGGAGGGGSGGYGASSHDSGSPGTANTGGGGGGGGRFRTTNIPGQGGSGIIIIRWNNA